MERDAGKIRTGGPTIFAQVKFGQALDEITKEILHAYQHATNTPHEHEHEHSSSHTDSEGKEPSPISSKDGVPQESVEENLESERKKQKVKKSTAN